MHLRFSFAVLLFCLVVSAQHPFADKLFRPREITKPSYIADPVGIMFNKFHETINKRNQSDPLFPDFRGKYGPSRYKSKLQTTAEADSERTQTPQTQTNRKSKIQFEGEVIEAREHPDKEKYIMRTSKSISHRTTNTTIHEPYDASPPGKECSGKGKEVGDLKNICQRRDCNVNILRCLPDYSIIVDNQNYSSVNLAQCKVEELQCMDEVITFNDWSTTEIYQLLCGTKPTHPSDGDLDHCSVLSVLEGNQLWNYTYAPENDPKCYIDEIICSHYCESIYVECDSVQVTCPTEIQCLDGNIACDFEYVICNNSTISCDDESFVCEDHYPNCDNYYVSCDGHNPCTTEVNGTLISYDMECNSDGLVECNGTLAFCDGHVLACADSERTICHDEPKRLESYEPEILCTDDLHLCKDIYVHCNRDKIYCEDGFTWVYNSSISDFPFCLKDEYLGDEYWYEYWHEEFIEQASSYSSDAEEYDIPRPSITFAKEICRIGIVTFNCSIETCENRTFVCAQSELECEYNNTEITGSFPDYHAYCNGKHMICITEPECSIIQHPCGPNDQCEAQVYKCDEQTPTKCGYYPYQCTDACWAREGDWECICPFDYYGRHCGTYRPYLCDFELIDPLPDCLDYDDPELNKIETEPVCLLYSVFDNIRFTYQMNCYFTDLTDIEKSNDPRVSFEYFGTRGNEFAWSLDREEPKVTLKVFNFNRLSDTAASIVLYLTKNQYFNQDLFYFDLNIAAQYDSKTHRERFFLGGRLYFEVDIYQERYGQTPKGMEKRQSDRRFLDFTDYEYSKPTVNFSDLDGFALYLYLHLADPTMIIVVFIAAASVYYFVYKHQRYTVQEELRDINQFKND